MPGVVGAEALAGELPLHVGVGLVVGVVATPGVVRVGPADQQLVRLRVGQHADVVLAVVLLESKGEM